MKIMHLGDLHIGKRVNEFSMIEDQRYILTKILNIIDKELVEVVIIAGDIYDKSIPTIEAVEVFDEFLVKLVKRKLKVLMISGNHDSAERIAFAEKILGESQVHISPVYDGSIKRVDIDNISFHLLPFIKPANVRRFFDEEEIENYTDAVKMALNDVELGNGKNILITHQFVTGASRTDSEEISVGGTDNVDGNIFEKFDYVALGHIHRAQKVLRDTIRYSGSPLKYSFSEANHKKTVTILDIADRIEIKEVELEPKRDLLEIKGKYTELVNKEFYTKIECDSYFHITLTDEEDIFDAIAKLRVIYPNIMKLDYDNIRTRAKNSIEIENEIEKKSPLDLFSNLYQLQNNIELTKEQNKYLNEIISNIWEENV